MDNEVKFGETYQVILDSRVSLDSMTEEQLDKADALFEQLANIIEGGEFYKHFDRLVVDFTKDSRR